MPADNTLFSTAQEWEQAIRAIARQEIDSARPGTRYAVVKEINREERYCMVIFVGEVDAVRVPYTDTAPAVVGQEVRIAGTNSDRYIESIRGYNDTEYRTASNESKLAETPFLIGKWGMETDVTYNATQVLPIISPVGPGMYDAVPFTENGVEYKYNNVGGRVTVPLAAYYYVQVEIRADQATAERSIILAIDPGGNVGGRYYVKESKGAFYYTGSDGNIQADAPIVCIDVLYLNAGDVIVPLTYSSRAMKIYAKIGQVPGTSMYIELKRRIPKYVLPTA